MWIGKERTRRYEKNAQRFLTVKNNRRILRKIKGKRASLQSLRRNDREYEAVRIWKCGKFNLIKSNSH